MDQKRGGLGGQAVRDRPPRPMEDYTIELDIEGHATRFKGDRYSYGSRGW